MLGDCSETDRVAVADAFAFRPAPVRVLPRVEGRAGATDREWATVGRAASIFSPRHRGDRSMVAESPETSRNERHGPQPRRDDRRMIEFDPNGREVALDEPIGRSLW